MGFALPPRRHSSSRPPHQTRKSSFGDRPPQPITCSVLVVSHHLDGFLREQAVSLLRLTTGQRFAAFPSISIPVHCRNSLRGRVLEFPATRFTPLEGFPSSAAAPCHHGRCLPDVPLTPNPAKPPPKSRPASQHQCPRPPKSAWCQYSPQPKSRFTLTNPCCSWSASRSCISSSRSHRFRRSDTTDLKSDRGSGTLTVNSEESTLNMSPTDLRGVLPNVVHSPPAVRLGS